PRIAETVERARAAGAVIVHAPSWLEQAFYAECPQWQRARALPPCPGVEGPVATLPESLESSGCPDRPACAFVHPQRPHPDIRIADDDWLISADPGDLLFRVLGAQPMGIVLVAGVH